jgi:Ca2+-binding RTX toxin-like protein
VEANRFRDYYELYYLHVFLFLIPYLLFGVCFTMATLHLDCLNSINFEVKNFNIASKESLSPLVGIIDTNFNLEALGIDRSQVYLGRDSIDNDAKLFFPERLNREHGSDVLRIVRSHREVPLASTGIKPLWLSRAVGSGKWADSLAEFVDTVKISESINAVINLSFDLAWLDSDGNLTTRYELTSKELLEIDRARQNGILIVVAAGNEGGAISALGRASLEFDNIITVGAAKGGVRAAYSSYGDGLTLLADGSSAGKAKGTSAAAARVTGAVVQLWQENSRLNYQQIIEILQTTATKPHRLGWQPETGFGLLNLTSSIELASSTNPIPYAISTRSITWQNELAVSILRAIERPAGFFDIFDDIFDGIGDIFEGAVDIASAPFEAVGQAIKFITDKTGDVIEGIFNRVGIPFVGDGLNFFIDRVGEKIQGVIEREIQFYKELPDRIERTTDDFFSENLWGNTGRWLVENIVNAIELSGIPEIAEDIADLLKFNTRALSDTEKDIARSVFGDSIDLDLVRIDEGSFGNLINSGDPGSRPFTTFNTINTWGSLDNATLIHELTHIWQYHNYGAIYIPDALDAQGSPEGYDYGSYAGLENHLLNGGKLSDLNYEQQAHVVEDYYAERTAADPNNMEYLPIYAYFAQEVSTLNIAPAVSNGDINLEGRSEKDLILLGSDSSDGTGNGRDNILLGNNGNNILDGSSGNDFMSGRAGDDTYRVDSAGDVVDERNFNNNDYGGIDTVESAITYSLDDANFAIDNLENLTLTGSSDINGVGNNLNNAIEGNAGSNILEGGGGQDTLHGEGGFDILFGGDGDDILLDAFLTDTSVNWFLGGNGNDFLWGSSGDEEMVGEVGDDTLLGEAGNDYLNGGEDNDTYDFGNVNNMGSDRIEDVSGIDRLYFATSNLNVNVDLGQTAAQIVNSNLTLTLKTADAIENIVGGAFSDILTGNALINSLEGGDGNDTLSGGARGDNLDGGGGIDTIAESDDAFFTTLNNLTLTKVNATGTDIDSLTSIESANLSGGSGNNYIDASAFTQGSVTLTGNDGNDILHGSSGSDYLNGGNSAGTDNSSNDAVFGHNGSDTLWGGNGNDNIDGGEGDDFVGGWNGIDRLFGGNGIDTLSGGEGDDTLYGGNGGDTLDGGGGIDEIFLQIVEPNNINFTLTDTSLVSQDTDSLNSIEKATLYGSGGDNSIDASAFTKGDVFLSGFGGNDDLFGGKGNDSLNAGFGEDFLSGGEGDDLLEGEAGSDILDGGEGIDRFTNSGNFFAQDLRDNFLRMYEKSSNTAKFAEIDTLDAIEDDAAINGNALVENDTISSIENATLTGGEGDNHLYAYYFTKGSVSLFGNGGTDVLNGGSGDDTLEGGSGNDTLGGHAGNDTLNGGTGSDLLGGGAGSDILVGGDAANDAFGFSGTSPFARFGKTIVDPNLGVDRIEDFDSNDSIVLDKTVFSGLQSNAGIGFTVFGFSVASEFAIVASDVEVANSRGLIVYSQATGNLFYNQNSTNPDLGSGGLFATLVGSSDLTPEDFVLQI